MNGLTVGGRYRLGTIIGKGRGSTVYRAVDTQLNLNTIVKLLVDDIALTEDFTRNFSDIMKRYALLEHERLVKVLDYGLNGNMPFIVLANFDQPNLEQQFAANGPMTPDQAAPVIEELAQALDYIHQHGLTHLEVKPGNAWQVDNTANLGDFFMAALRNEIDHIRLQKGYTVEGYLRQPCPEMFRGEPLTGASDQYGLGATLYRLLTGVAPFTQPTTNESGEYFRWIETFRDTQPPDPRQYKPEIAKNTAEVIMTVLAPRPADRFSSCGDFAEVFRRSLHDPFYTPPRPVYIPPTSPPPLAPTISPTNPYQPQSPTPPQPSEPPTPPVNQPPASPVDTVQPPISPQTPVDIPQPPAPVEPPTPPKTRKIGAYTGIEALNSISEGPALTLLGRIGVFGREVVLEYVGQSEELPPEAGNKFEFLMQKARDSISLRHTGILSPFDIAYETHADMMREDGIGLEPTTHNYVVFPRLKSQTLRERLQEVANRPVPVSEVNYVLSQLAPALDFAHWCGIEHGRVNPDDILRDERNLVVLRNFGIERLREHLFSQSDGQAVHFNSHYCSPEEWNSVINRLPDQNIRLGVIDQYSLGLIAYEMLTGRQPLKLAGYFSPAWNAIPNIRQFNPQLPAPLAGVIDRALAYDWRARFGSVGEFAAIFRRVAGL